MAKERIIEIANSLSLSPISERDFIISDPALIPDSDRIEFTIFPRNHTGLYGLKKVSLTRINLGIKPTQFIDYRGEQFVHDLVKSNVLGIYNNYAIAAIGNPQKIVNRLLRPLKEDLVNDVIIANSSTTNITIRANPNSYFFFGQREIVLRRVA